MKKRIMQHDIDYYQHAMKQAGKIDLFNQSTQSNDFFVHIFWCSYSCFPKLLLKNSKSNLHCHSFYELQCILSGEFEYMEPNFEPKILSAGDFILVAPHYYHCLKPMTSNAEKTSVTFEPICSETEEGSKINMRFDAITSINGKIHKKIQTLLEMIMAELHDGHPFVSQIVKSLLNVLVLEVIRIIFNQAPAPEEEKILHDTLHDSRMLSLESFVNEHSDRIITVAEAAEFLNLTPRQLSNVVQTDTGLSTKQFLDRLKAQQARKLLLETNLELLEISEQLGFSDHNNFNRFFKRVEGMSPGLLRHSATIYYT